MNNSFFAAPLLSQPSAHNPNAMPLAADAQGRLQLAVAGTQTITAQHLDIAALSGSAVITAANLAIGPLTPQRNALAQGQLPYNTFYDSVLLVLGGTTVLQADTLPYAKSTFVVRADFISALTTVYLQVAPADIASYYTTISSATSLVLGGLYVFTVTVPLRYARIFATGIGSQLSAWYVGQV